MRLKDQVIIICKGYLVFTCLGKEHLPNYLLMKGEITYCILFSKRTIALTDFIREQKGSWS